MEPVKTGNKRVGRRIENEVLDLENIIYLNNELDLIDKIKDKFIVYGAGKVASVLIKFIHTGYFSKNISCIIVADKRNNPSEILGISVYCIDEIEEYFNDIPIIIATMENLHSSIIESLKEKARFSEIYAVSNVLYRTLRMKNPSYETEILQEIKAVSHKIRDCAEKVEEHCGGTVWVDNGTRERLRKNYGNFIERENFADKFLKLISGLDSESVSTVTLIVKRINRILNTNSKRIDLFNRDEKKQLKILKEDFYDLILEVSKNIYVYKNYILPSANFQSSVFYYKHGIEKIKNIENVKGKIIIDAGGYIGDSALVLSELKPKKIYSFEAIPKHIELMKKTIHLNKLKDVEPVQYALGRKKGTVKMNLAGEGTSYVDRNDVEFSGSMVVPLISLDEYVDENNIKDIALIKVDIEGAEPEFILGAERTIKRDKPILLLSIYHNGYDFMELKGMVEDLKIDYHFSVFKPIDGKIVGETLLIAECF